ncbi:MAG: formimidoylglutamase [Candidatus Berkiella sp.]
MHNYPKFSKLDYTKPDPANWQGRTDNGDALARFFQIAQCQSLDSFIASGSSVSAPTITLLGFSCDEGVRRNQGRVGAEKAPSKLRQALANLPLHEKARQIKLLDVGDIKCPTGSVDNLENAQIHLGHAVDALLNKKTFPLILGGGHETAWGHYLGLHKHLPSNMAIINFDAHFDMRPLLPNQQGSSGTPFLQIAEYRKAQQLSFDYYCLGIKQSSNTQALFDTASAWNVKYLTCDQMYQSADNATHFIQKIIDTHDALYLSVCLDVFAAAFAPGVSACSPYGLAPWQVLPLLKQLAVSKKVIAFDVVELAPIYDKDDLTAKLGAQCIAEFLYHYEPFHLA